MRFTDWLPDEGQTHRIKFNVCARALVHRELQERKEKKNGTPHNTYTSPSTPFSQEQNRMNVWTTCRLQPPLEAIPSKQHRVIIVRSDSGAQAPARQERKHSAPHTSPTLQMSQNTIATPRDCVYTTTTTERTRNRPRLRRPVFTTEGRPRARVHLFLHSK